MPGNSEARLITGLLHVRNNFGVIVSIQNLSTFGQNHLHNGRCNSISDLMNLLFLGSKHDVSTRERHSCFKLMDIKHSKATIIHINLTFNQSMTIIGSNGWNRIS